MWVRKKVATRRRFNGPRRWKDQFLGKIPFWAPFLKILALKQPKLRGPSKISMWIKQIYFINIDQCAKHLWKQKKVATRKKFYGHFTCKLWYWHVPLFWYSWAGRITHPFLSVHIEAIKYERILIYIEFIWNLECFPYNKMIFLYPKHIHLAQKRVIF